MVVSTKRCPAYPAPDGRPECSINQNYIYRRMKAEILLNTRGIEIVDRVSMANTERALCDKLYLDGNEHFDNLRGIDWEEMRNLNRLVYGGNKTIADFIEENGE